MGANLYGSWGAPKDAIRHAITQLHTHNIRTLSVSSVYETEPIGATQQSCYMNLVLSIATSLSARSLLRKVKQVERQAGRRGLGQRWGARELDIDIIDYRGMIQNWNLRKMSATGVRPGNIILPHSTAHLRPFVLFPLTEILPKWRHPIFFKTANSLLQSCYAMKGKKGEILRKHET